MGFLRKKLRKKKEEKRPFCSAVVVAAGASERMGTDKLMLDLGGMPVLARTLKALQACTCIDEIVVVTQPEKIVPVAKLCKEYGITLATKILSGGATRAESALIGLSEISSEAALAAIHDGARPLVTPAVVSAAVEAASRCLAAAPAVPVKDTVKIAENGVVAETPDRESTMAVQTPQVFQPDIIKGALTYALEQEIPVTDDCSAVELLGVDVFLTPGDEENIKITTPLDISLAETILRRREGA